MSPRLSPQCYSSSASCPLRQRYRPADRRDHVRAHPDPAENAALGLDHLEPKRLEFREIGADTIFENETIEAAIVRLAHRRVDADFGRDARHDELTDAPVF